MKAYYLLYSRTFSQDYRWILSPDWAATDDLRKLREIYESYDVYKQEKVFNSEGLSSVYCINLPSISALVSCSPANYQDQYSRKIFSLHGIAVHPDQIRQFWFIIPWLLDNHNKVLNAWKSIKFDDSDLLSKTSLQVNENDFEDVFESWKNSWRESFSNEVTQLEFSKMGFENLIAITSSPYLPLVNFAFGATPETLKAISNWRIIAPISQSMNVLRTSNEKKEETITNKSNEDVGTRYTKQETSTSYRSVKLSSKKIEDNTSNYIYLYWSQSGVFIRSTEDVVDNIGTLVFPPIQDTYPLAKKSKYLAFDVNSFVEMRFHRLENEDADVGGWLLDYLISKNWEVVAKDQNQYWLRKEKKPFSNK